MDNQQAEIPRQWFCPITQQLMKDPAIASDGFTYERVAILQWFTKSNHSPMTNLPLPSTNLIPNHALRRTIQQHLQKNQLKGVKHQLKLAQLQKIQPNYEVPNILVNIDSAVDEDELYIRCEIQPPLLPQIKRNSCSIICILDVSQSMDTDSVMGGKDLESHGFSRLDLVKHSINTIVEFLDDTDEVALVPFSTSARIALPLTRTTAAGKNLIKQTTRNLQSNGTTNIWDGFRVSIQILKQLQKRQRLHNTFVLLLTDGQPNLNPPRGIVPTLIKFLDLEKLPAPNIHVFGYGYELDTNLLAQIAEVGHGTYTYIPDCSMVGTGFVNFMAGAISTIVNDLTLKITDLNQKSELKQIVGFKKNEKNSYNLGVLQYGQRREFVLKYPARILNNMTETSKIGNLMLTYGQQKVIQKEIQLKPTTQNQQKMARCILRSKYLELLGKLMKQKKNNIQNCQKMIDEFYQKVMLQYEKFPSEFAEVLLKQLKNTASQNEGQVSKAFQKEEWFLKWGRHYIPSLFRAHLMQACTNFKDPALQLYGGPVFEQNRSIMDSIFIKMAPPQPSAKKIQKFHYKAIPVDMSDYYNYGGGCIHEDCWVLMADGSKKMIKQLKKGDKAKGGIIKCMIKTNVFNWVQMSMIGNLIITPWHPIKINKQWVFPSEYVGSRTQKIFIEAYYNFVMQNSVSIICEDIECISLGHKINDNPVTSHEYLSGRIIQDLNRSKGWSQGQITIGKFVRDSVTKRIVGVELSE